MNEKSFLIGAVAQEAGTLGIEIADVAGSVEDVVNAMLKLHGDRDNPRALWHSARTAVAKRG